MRSRLVSVTACGPTTTPPLGSAANAVRRWSISCASCTPSATSLIFSAGAKASANLKYLIRAGVWGCSMNPIRSTWGATSLSSSTFSADRRRVPIGEPCEVAVGTRIVADKTGTDRIANKYENYWYGADFLLNNRRHQISVGDQHVRCEAHQPPEHGACPAGIGRRKTNINADIAPFLPAQLPHLLPQRGNLGLCRSVTLGIPHHD